MEGVRKLNPFYWSKRTVRVFLVAFFLIALPIYTYIGLQPASSIEASHYPKLKISSISLETPVATLELVDHQLIAPVSIAGSYQPNPTKTFIIGHSSTVFKNLSKLINDEKFIYNEKIYKIIKIETLTKEAVNMPKILAPTETETIILMTCAGEPLPNQDATHRLIITAERIE